MFIRKKYLFAKLRMLLTITLVLAHTPHQPVKAMAKLTEFFKKLNCSCSCNCCDAAEPEVRSVYVKSKPTDPFEAFTQERIEKLYTNTKPRGAVQRQVIREAIESLKKRYPKEPPEDSKKLAFIFDIDDTIITRHDNRKIEPTFTLYCFLLVHFKEYIRQDKFHIFFLTARTEGEKFGTQRRLNYMKYTTHLEDPVTLGRYMILKPETKRGHQRSFSWGEGEEPTALWKCQKCAELVLAGYQIAGFIDDQQSNIESFRKRYPESLGICLPNEFTRHRRSLSSPL